MAGLPPVTGGPGGNTDALGVQLADNVLAGVSRKGDGQDMGRVPLAGVQCANPLGPANLMGGECDIVRAEGFHGEGYLQKPLHGVGMEQGGAVLKQGGNLLHRETDAGLVVDQHDADQGRVLPEGGQHLPRRDAPRAVGPHIGDRAALLLQPLDALEHRAVLHGGGDNVAAYPAVLVEGGADGPVIPLRAAGSEKKLLRGAPQGPGNNGPAPVHQILGPAAQLVLG